MNEHSGDEAGPCRDLKRPLRIEVCLKPKCKVKKEEIKTRLKRELVGRAVSPCGGTDFDAFEDATLQQNVSEVLVVNNRADLFVVNEAESNRAEFCLFQLNFEEVFSEDLDEDSVVAEVTELPSNRLHGLWPSLTYEGTVKEDLLEYARTAMLFSEKNVDCNIINWNRIILLHGPPGTGKTSLCRALAHKLSITMSDRYRVSQLFEVNSHSLFSKWFSESGKLVMRMFQRVKELVLDPSVLICVLIDEVESLSGCREGMGSSEPSDSIRVVNALLTQLDSIKRYSNVIVIATSNLCKNIDPAFIDRVDIMQYIGNPGKMAIYHIFHSCISELAKRSIIISTGDENNCSNSQSYSNGHTTSSNNNNINNNNSNNNSSGGKECLSDLMDMTTLQLCYSLSACPPLSPSTQLLLSIAQRSEGLSGRTLRKLPFIAHAMFVQTPSSTLSTFLHALQMAVDKHQSVK